jgi:hypothetical protein
MSALPIISAGAIVGTPANISDRDGIRKREKMGY